ncbi:levanase [Aliiglaciecola lipolytica E3]|uniref:Levanase n=2 Tax=Aliiglaciecola TaxID=1406885 RepID=K6YAM8_9ALTE|nr:levanase [Aliiglaciecola lipolytica E3]
MHWGHATSIDLIHWQHHSPAICSEPDGLGYIFSGSALVDWHNSSGLQQGEHPPLLAIFTHNSRHDKQVQSIAYSVDGGDQWQQYCKNPVIKNPGLKDFRDPKVIWHNDSKRWIMVLAAGNVVQFYSSVNLLEWQYMVDFGKDFGAHGGVWECPDFFPLKVDGSKEEKWVLLVSISPGGPNKGSATQYFIGEFDGTRFVQQHTEILWMDYGPDCYAGVTFSDIPKLDGRRIMLAWMTNWLYASQQPTAPWRGAMTFPRELTLVKSVHGIRLSAKPIAELSMLRLPNPINFQQIYFDKPISLDSGQALAECLELHLTIDWSEHLSDKWILRFHNEIGEALIIDFNSSINQLEIDRSKANYRLSHIKEFNNQIKAPVELGGKKHISLIILKDASSIEIFTDNGLCVSTTTYFVEAPLSHLDIQSGHNDIPMKIKSAQIYSLESIWH